jgi:hypothetical protein
VKRLLHVGCGPHTLARLPACFRDGRWQEIRFDIDASVTPDIVGSMTDMSALKDGAIDALWSAHNLEHLDSFNVPVALAEFRRVLGADGFAVITVPNLRAVARHVADDHLETPLYESAAGTISPLDVMFGHQDAIAGGKPFMAHRTGFSARTLGEALIAAGFSEVRVHEGRKWDLWAIASVNAADPAVFDQLSEVIQ